MLRVLIAIAALLIYGSLYPWQFHPGRGAEGAVGTLLHSWHLSLNAYGLRDIALNIAIYIPFGAAAYLWLSSRTFLLRFLAPVLMSAVLSVAIELAQYFDGTRNTSLVDVAMNILGAGVGMLLATTIAKRGKSSGVIRMKEPGALLLVGCWAGAMLFPLIPDLSRGHLAAKVASFLTDGPPSVAIFGLFAGWLVAARLLRATLGADVGGLVFPLLGMALPARFFVLGLNAGWTYWVSFLIAWLLWAAFLNNSRRSEALLGCFTLLSILLTGLSPFHFSGGAGYFEWVPFRALFSTEWEIGFATFLRKAFFYGAAVWLFRESGVRLRWAALAVALFLAGIEALQLYLPGHASESTDPLLAILMAWLIHRLARARVRPGF